MLQWILVIVSFATLSNSKVWVDIKTLSAADSNYKLVSTEKVNNFTTTNKYSPAAKFCDNKVLDGPGKLLPHDGGQQFSATGVLYSYVLDGIDIWTIMYVRLHGRVWQHRSKMFQKISGHSERRELPKDSNWN